VIFARYAKAHHPLWFHLHRIFNVTGLILTLTGFIIALKQFGEIDADSRKFTHACLGCTVMSLGLFQPLNAAIRPHPNPNGKQPLKRLVWEATHKVSGILALILSVVTNFLGGYLFSERVDPRLFPSGEPLIFVYTLSGLLGILGTASVICETLRRTGYLPHKPGANKESAKEQVWLAMSDDARMKAAEDVKPYKVGLVPHQVASGI